MKFKVGDLVVPLEEANLHYSFVNSKIFKVFAVDEIAGSNFTEDNRAIYGKTYETRQTMLIELYDSLIMDRWAVKYELAKKKIPFRVEMKYFRLATDKEKAEFLLNHL